MEKNSEAYTALLETLRLGIVNNKNFSRLDKIHYAFACLKCAIAYKAEEFNLDSSTITPRFEIFQNNSNGGTASGETHNYFDKQGNLTTDVSLGLQFVLSAFKGDPIRIMQVALHEVSHAVDARIHDKYPPTKIDLRENIPENPNAIKFSPECNKEWADNYKNFGVVWKGNPKELYANEGAFSTMEKLIRDLSSEEQDKPALSKNFAETYINFNNQTLNNQKQLVKEYEEYRELLSKKSEEYFSTNSKNIDNVPNPNEANYGDNSIIDEYQKRFISIETIDKVAQENKELFLTPNYLSVLGGAQNPKSVDIESANQFKIENDKSIDLVVAEAQRLDSCGINEQ